PRLLAGDDPVVALATRATRERGGVGAGRRLGQRQRHHRLATGDARQPAPADLGVAVLTEDLARERRELDAVRAAEVAARRLLHRDAEHREVGVDAAVLDRNTQPEQAELAHPP